MKGFYVSASGAIQGHHGPLVDRKPTPMGKKSILYYMFLLKNSESKSLATFSNNCIDGIKDKLTNCTVWLWFDSDILLVTLGHCL